MDPTGLETKFKKIKNIENNMCFGCGDRNPSGLHLEFYTDGESVHTWSAIPGHMCGWSTLAHGGILSTVLDEVTSWTAIYMTGKFVVTRSIAVDYHRPVFINSPIHAVGRLVNADGSKELSVAGEIYNEKGKLCVSARSSFAIVSSEFMTRVIRIKDSSIEEFMKFADQRNWNTVP